jgi:hypothetical protein
MKPILCLLLCLLINAKASREPATAPQFSFVVQLEKNTFKPGGPIEALAVLHNQSAIDIYVPHVMTTCSGPEAHVVFSLSDIKGHAVPALKGRGCGIGGGCGDCGPPLSFEDHVKSSWILLHPGEMFGSRVDTLRDAPESAGIYTIHAEYVPQQLVTGNTSGPPGNQIHVIARSYEAAPVPIIVAR